MNVGAASANLALMPIYEYLCRDGHTTDLYRSVDARHDPAVCAKCGLDATKVISRVGHTVPDIAGYRSTITGEWIGSRSTHRAHLKQHECIEIGNEKQTFTPKAMPRARDDVLRAWETTK